MEPSDYLAAKISEQELPQAVLIDKMKSYFLERSKKPQKENVTQDERLPYATASGICSGLVTYRLYCKRIGREDLFAERIKYLLNWDAKAFETSEQLEDHILEELISNIIFLQYEDPLREPGVTQSQLGISINTILHDKLPKVAVEPEFKIIFVFNRKTLALLLQQIVRTNKMIRIDNGFHTVGVMKDTAAIELYDPRLHISTFNNIAGIVDNLFSQLSAFCKSTEYIALNIRIFDLQTQPKLEYPNIAQYRDSLMQDTEYRDGVIHHPNIYNLALRNNDYSLADYLFANGYVYIPWQYNAGTELTEAVKLDDMEKFDYIIAHGYPLDTMGQFGIGAAIVFHKHLMLYKLLSLQVDPNAEPTPGWPALKMCELHNNRAAIIMLLAFGADIPNRYLSNLKDRLGKFIYNTIINQVVALNAIILRLPKMFILDNAKLSNAISFLRNAKLRLLLGYPLKDIHLSHNGVILKGNNAIRAVAKAFPLLDNWHDFNALEELYELIRFFRLPDCEETLQQELVSILNPLIENITTKDFRDHSPEDLSDINLVVNNLQDLCSQHKDRDAMFALLHSALTQIMAYLDKNKFVVTRETSNHKMLFFSDLQPTHLLSTPVYDKIIPYIKPVF